MQINVDIDNAFLMIYSLTLHVKDRQIDNKIASKLSKQKCIMRKNAHFVT